MKFRTCGLCLPPVKGEVIEKDADTEFNRCCVCGERGHFPEGKSYEIEVELLEKGGITFNGVVIPTTYKVVKTPDNVSITIDDLYNSPIGWEKQ